MEKSFNHRDLEIWQLGMDLVEHIYRVTAEFPDDERFGLISQVRRAAVSVPTNISEGWGRHSQANLANFVRIARGSLCELDTLVELAKRLGFLTEEAWAELNLEMDVIGRKSYAFLRKVEASTVHENRHEYSFVHINPKTLAAISELGP